MYNTHKPEGDGKNGDIGGESSGQGQISPPAVSLPRGGGAIRGIGEKFAANPVTGAGSVSIPITTSPGRAGFGPQLALAYDSGAGNGPFGIGWSLSLAQISRKTDKGLPRYSDAEESDVFILSGAEDLVPEFKKDGAGEWIIKDGRYQMLEEPVTVGGVTYLVRRYRPRIEGPFARIERWTRQSDGDVHWRSISRDNILTLYGLDGNSRIADPADATSPRRIFTWLICETRDDKGNAVIYEYKPEDGTGIDLTQAHERNRGDRDDPRRTANRYLKRILYGNRQTLLDDSGSRPLFLTPAARQNAGWMFDVVFDYGEHDPDAPQPDDDPGRSNSGLWPVRNDPFSTYRPGFEVRTCRLCQRVLMFHHFQDEPGVGPDCLVRSTDFTYSYEQNPADARNPVYSFLLAVCQSGYRRQGDGYLKASLPPLEFEYSRPQVQDTVREVDAESLANLPVGLDGAAYQWADLHGEGLPGILTEQGGAWFYKRNLSPISQEPGSGAALPRAKFAPVEVVATRPHLGLAGGQAQFMDLAGDGLPDLVVLDGPGPGLYEHDDAEGWQPFRPFIARPNRSSRDPNLKLIDLDGDGHADLLLSEDGALVWHPSLAEDGFGPACRTSQAPDEEEGPRLVFADGAQSIYLADLSGDGLTDLVRIRNGQVCYWPNLGYGRFGAKVTMDRSPVFDRPERFDQRRIRLADIDGSGTTDIVYLHPEGVRLYFNQSGNGWSAPLPLPVFPRLDDLASITLVDLLGNGAACLVWSSPLPGDTRRQMRYVDLMGGQKPHLLLGMANNLGAEIRIQYAPSTRFYLQDRRDGRPWLTRLPFPVHVVERVETYDHISRNRFVTRYAYHHGYFDGVEREFRGFGLVEQWDTEEFAALGLSQTLPVGDNAEAASHVPPVYTRTWFHTGFYLDRDHFSRQFEHEYYREPGLTDTRALLLPDTVLSPGLSFEQEREACRALKGSLLRQEVYGLDGSGDDAYPFGHPYTVLEQNFTVEPVQPRGQNRHAVFFSHGRETLTFHYERYPNDPRVQHALTLAVDPFGNVLKSAQIGYGRRRDAADEILLPGDREQQRLIHITCTENSFTQPIIDRADGYRAPLPAETRTYELRRPQQETSEDGLTRLYRFETLMDHIMQAGDGQHEVDYTDIQFERARQAAANNPEEAKKYFRRLIEQVRTFYRPDDLGAAQNDPDALLPLGQVQALALPGDTFRLAFTPDLLDRVYVRDGQKLLPPEPAEVLKGGGPGRGGYILSQDGKAAGLFPGADPDDQWWLPGGRVFLSPGRGDTAAQELAYARQRFFLPHRYRDPFHSANASTESVVTYDAYDLLLLETRDALDNRVTVGERTADGDIDPTRPGNDYRVLQPWRVMDPNRNRTQVAFDTLGMVVGTAVMGKPEESLGDSLDGFQADLAEAAILDHLANPHALLGRATTRLVYDLLAYQRTRNQPEPQPAVVHVLARETHSNDLDLDQQTKIQHSFSYSDGFGREIQKKLQAEPGPAPRREASGALVLGPDGRPEMTAHDVNPRWVGSGWTVFNNKGQPVRQYEPFFSDTHRFEFDLRIGVSPVLFYDPAGRVVATLHPNHTWEKVIFGPWRQESWDASDTVGLEPQLDREVKGFFIYPDGAPRLPVDEYLPTWLALRTDPAHAAEASRYWPDPRSLAAEKAAADKAAIHAATPTVAHFDTLGRAFLTVAHNRLKYSDSPPAGESSEEFYCTRTRVDIKGNLREVRDALEQNDPKPGRLVIRYHYDLIGRCIYQASMDAGGRWLLNDAANKPVRAWDSRGHAFRTEYDPLRRPLRSFVTGANRDNPAQELLTERLVYGEQHPESEGRNLRGRFYLHLDGAGVVSHEVCDFKGNSLHSARRLAREYKGVAHWAGVEAALPPGPTTPFDPATLEAALAPRLETGLFTSQSRYDALNRPVLLHTPDNSAIRPGYNEAGLLERLEVMLRGASDNGQPAWTPFVTNINYDAKGRRVQIDYGNGARTSYAYDPLTFRLARQLTRRNAAAFPDDCPQPPPAGWPGCQVQNLHYTYDPAGNITRIRDDAQQMVYFRNQRVEPGADYTYDACYRLIEAAGREHLGQAGGAPVPHSADDAPRTGLLHPGDGEALGAYLERYLYDAAGNFLEVQHQGSDPAHPGWRRSFAYQEASLLEPARPGNRLSSTMVGANNPPPERYAYDAHGNMTRLPHLAGAFPEPNLRWDYRDQLSQVDLGGGGTAYYVYDAAGRRARKVLHRQNGTRREEYIYLGGYEIYREFNGDGQSITLERETMHVMDDSQRLALVETRTRGNDPAPPQLIRYQLGNHLGSAGLELDDQARIISYEEYTPYGSTAYQAVRSQTETPKRYRYTGKERDEESGLYYHGARYYAPWLGRWTSCDPILVREIRHPYTFVVNNPLKFIDPDGKDEKPPSTTGSYHMPSNRADLGTLVHNVVLKTLQLRLAVLGLSSAVEVETRADGSKNMKSTNPGRVDLALLLPDPQKPGSVQAQLYELKPRVPDKYQDYVSEVDHYAEHFPTTVDQTPVSRAKIGTALNVAAEMVPQVFEPITISNSSLEVTIHLDLARDNNNTPIPGVIVYDVGVRQKRPGEDNNIERVKQMLKTDIRQTAEAQAHGMVRTSIMVGGSIVTLDAAAQILILGGGLLLAGAGTAGTGTAATGTVATTGVRVATGVRIAEGVGQTTRTRVASELVEELVEQSGEVLKRMQIPKN